VVQISLTVSAISFAAVIHGHVWYSFYCITIVHLFLTDADAHYNFGLMLMQIHDDDQGAEMMYRHCVKVNPRHASAFYNLANLLYVIRGNFLEAEIMYRRAIDLDNTHLAAICNYGTLLKVSYQQGDFVAFRNSARPHMIVRYPFKTSRTLIGPIFYHHALFFIVFLCTFLAHDPQCTQFTQFLLSVYL
jgi:tetratricopeptide (TPR) repeat protein